MEAMPKQAVAPITKRLALNVRTTEELRSKLELAAQASGRVLSHEVDARLQASFDLEADLALQDEIKAEMRGTIAALEARIASIEEGNNMLWPDEGTRLLGKSFAMTLAAVQHATGQNWRESPTAPAIVAGVMRRAMEESGRGGSLLAEMRDRERVAATTDAIARGVVDGLRAKLPPLPDRQPQNDPANWTNLARLAVVFRDKATGDVLETVRGEEYDITAPGGRPPLGADYRAAFARFEPIRDTIEAEDFLVHRLKDGSAVWDSLTNPGNRTVASLTGQPEATRRMAGVKPAPGQLPPSIGDRALFDETMGDPRPDDGDPTPPAPADVPAPRPRRRVKAPV